MRGFHPPAKSPTRARGFSPATATAMAAALAQAQNQAPDSIPAMVKPGEFVLPPDTVHAMGGPDALQGVVNATHTRVRGFAPRAQPEEPRQFFADGGLVKPKRGFDVGMWAQQQEQQRAADTQAALAAGKAAMDEADAQAASRQGQKSPVGMTPDQAYRAGLIASPTPIGREVPAPEAQPAERPAPSDAARGFSANIQADAPDGQPTAVPASGNVTRVGNSYSGGNVGGDITVNGNTPGGGASATSSQGTRGFSPAMAANAVPTDWKDTIAKVEAMGFKQLPAQPLGEAGATTATTEGSAGAGRGFVNAAPAKPGTPQAQQAAATAGKEVMAGVYEHGRGQYSDSATGLGFAPGFTGQPSAQNLAAADNLARGFVPGGNASPVVGGGSASAPAGITAPTVRNSTNDWAARKQLENLATGASSITNRPEWQSGRTTIAGSTRGPNGAGDPEGKVAAYKAAVANDQALQLAQPGLEQTAMRENGGLQREAVQQTGETSRTRLQQALADIRERRAAGQQATQNDLARQRIAIDAARASRDGVPSGYRPKADGTGLEYIPGGPADPATQAGKKPLNDTQAKALQFGTRMQQAGQNLDALAAAGVDQPGIIKRVADVVGAGALANWSQSPQQQQVEQSQRDFVNAVLRRESGAAISNSEFDNARQQYFPQVGDTDKVIEQKRRNRELATRGILAEVPDSEKRVQQVTAADQPPQQPQRAVSRTGTINGRKVVQYSDGSIHYAD